MDIHPFSLTNAACPFQVYRPSSSTNVATPSRVLYSLDPVLSPTSLKYKSAPSHQDWFLSYLQQIRSFIELLLPYRPRSNPPTSFSLPETFNVSTYTALDYGLGVVEEINTIGRGYYDSNLRWLTAVAELERRKSIKVDSDKSTTALAVLPSRDTYREAVALIADIHADDAPYPALALTPIVRWYYNESQIGPFTYYYRWIIGKLRRNWVTCLVVAGVETLVLVCILIYQVRRLPSAL